MRAMRLWRVCARGFSSTRIGVVFDIDGVVRRGGRVIPGAKEALQLLRDREVPFVFMTNGGGTTEARKAEELGKLLDLPGLTSEHLLLSHTPLASLGPRLRRRRALLVGGAETRRVAQSYGFEVGSWAVTSSQLAHGTPELFPWPMPEESLPPINANDADAPPFEAVLVFFEPSNWQLELQVVMDVLAGGSPLGSGTRQRAELWCSNQDFLWQAGYPVARFGAGSFVECLQALWRRQHGSELQVQECGKPFRVQFDAAKEMLGRLAKHPDFERIYMIGDNPQADIRGANAAGDPWRSVLVCTGVYQGGVASNDPQDPAWRVEEDVLAAVRGLLA